MLRLSLICFCLAITQSIAYECKKDGLFRDPENPHKYYNCNNGKASSLPCPDNLVFDEIKQACDFDSNVKTVSPQTSPTTHKQEVTTHEPKISTHGPDVSTQKLGFDCAGKINRFYKDPTDPHKYHECVKGNDYVGTCLDDLVFDESRAVCDFASNVKTVSPQTSPTTHKQEVTTHGPKVSTHGPDVSTQKSGFDCVGKINTFYKDPTDPHKFHECVKGKDYVYTCPDDLVFDGSRKVCDFASIVKTVSPQTSPTTHKQEVTTHEPEVSTHGPEVSTQKSGFDCAGKINRFYKDPTDPHKYHECVKGNDYVGTCLDDLVFDESRAVCDFASNVKTVSPQTNPTTHKQEITTHGSEVSTQKSGVDCVGKTGTLSKDPTDPHKFHECVNGKDEVFTCPGNLIFNEAKSLCEFGL